MLKKLGTEDLKKAAISSFTNSYFHNSYDLISASCHYDNNTLLTKNGELVQAIQIKGISMENISSQLSELRQMIRESIRTNVDTEDVSCWIHTVRRKTNLDDPQKYPNLMSQNIHDIWVKKNYWDDKFINTLYLSFVFRGLEIGTSDSSSIVKNFSGSKLIKKHEAYLEGSKQILDRIVDGVVLDLKEFASKKLGIIFKGDEVYCEIVSFYYSLLTGLESEIKISETDLSKEIGAFKYAVGSDKMEIVASDRSSSELFAGDRSMESPPKFYSVLSIKEYHEISSNIIDKLLQLPTEMVITEIIYFITPQEAKEKVQRQKYIAEVSGDTELLETKAIDMFLESENKYKLPYCNQQISLGIFGHDLDRLDHNTHIVSFQLSKLGLVHVREDIKIENYFWAQVPGNFKFVRRLSAMPVETIASFASLHNFPVGLNNNPWGRAVTILRTEKGTPFFFNFHSKSDTGRSLVIGTAKSGKTTILNFFISESLKYDPNVLFIASTKESYVFIKGNGGKWREEPFRLDPFKIASVRSDEVIIREFIRVMSGDHLEPLLEEEKKSLELLTNYFLNIPNDEKSMVKLSSYDFAGVGGEGLKAKMADYLIGGQYYEYFHDDGKWETEVTKILTIDFHQFTDDSYNKVHYPKEDRMLPEYYKKYKKFASFREIFATTNVLKYADYFGDKTKQIIKIENFNTVCSTLFSINYYRSYFDRVCRENIIYLNSLQYSDQSTFFRSELWQLMHELFETKIYLSAEAVDREWQNRLMLTDKEYDIIKSMLVSSRLFLVKQDGRSATCELSLGGFQGILRLLLSDRRIVEKCNEIMAIHGEDPKNWLIEFYDSIR